MDLLDVRRRKNGKPREQGLTMVMDKGLGVQAFTDWLELAGEYIDMIKLGFGTMQLMSHELLAQKCAVAKHYQIGFYPGGTLFECYAANDLVEPYLDWLVNHRLKWIEISDGSFFYSDEQRVHWIKRAQERGLRVVTEIGQKEKGSIIPWEECCRQYCRDRDAGAEYVIIEGRECGESIGIYNQQGEADGQYVERVVQRVGSKYLIWESPQKKQQVALLQLLGPNVNLGNIVPDEVLSLESLRHGLRADTFLWR